jgi:hypothetical protein
LIGSFGTVAQALSGACRNQMVIDFLDFKTRIGSGERRMNVRFGIGSAALF